MSLNLSEPQLPHRDLMVKGQVGLDIIFTTYLTDLEDMIVIPGIIAMKTQGNF